MSNNLRAAFGDIKKAQAPKQRQTKAEALTLTPPPVAPAPAEGKGKWTRGAGKSANPDFERMTVYVRKETKKATERKREDEGTFADVSELVQSLLTKYLNA